MREGGFPWGIRSLRLSVDAVMCCLSHHILLSGLMETVQYETVRHTNNSKKPLPALGGKEHRWQCCYQPRRQGHQTGAGTMSGWAALYELEKAQPLPEIPLNQKEIKLPVVCQWLPGIYRDRVTRGMWVPVMQSRTGPRAEGKQESDTFSIESLRVESGICIFNKLSGWCLRAPAFYNLP